MRGTLAAHNVEKAYGSHVVLERVSLAVQPAARIGLIGPNGSGKSTLLRILAGLEPPDAGRVARTPEDLSVGYLPQETSAGPRETLRGYLARRSGLADVERELDDLAARLHRQPELAGDYSDALERFLARGGGDFEARAQAVAAELGLPGRLDSELGAMSGGEAARAALAGLLLARFDLFLLDEPTNDLDFAGLERLEGFLASLSGGVVVVSHDRAFLERTVTRIVEFEPETRRVREYAGSWAEYEHARAAARRSEEDAYGRYVEERDRFGGLLSERRTQARAAGKQADRRGTHALSSKVRSAERRLERLERVPKPWSPWELQLALAPRARSGQVVARLEGAIIEREGFRLGPLSLQLDWGDRLALVGPNGSGKTTLLQALLGMVPLSAGRRWVGPGVVFGELDQGRGLLAGDEPLLESFRTQAELPALEARTLLAKFRLRADHVLRPSHSLSPGERTRALLALLAARGVNCLVLDEPTNHLDLEAIEELESALTAYRGTVLLVTHDRRFLDSFGATRTLELGA